MGDVIVLAERLRDRSRPCRERRPAFFFDLCCPFSYLAAERIERLLGDVEWVPIPPLMPAGVDISMRLGAEMRAAELRLPLVWPERLGGESPSAVRAAAFAAQAGAGARFALAAMRLRFCGGFDLEDPEILAEAAAAAGIGLTACLAAVNDESFDATALATVRGLRARGVQASPAVRIGRRLIAGEDRLPEAAALMRVPAAVSGPLAPVG